jgi:hypothetical protein
MDGRDSYEIFVDCKNLLAYSYRPYQATERVPGKERVARVAVELVL